jgi:hypothetical protein
MRLPDRSWISSRLIAANEQVSPTSLPTPQAWQKFFGSTLLDVEDCGADLTPVSVGFHATDAASFAGAIHQAFSLSAGEAKLMREAARKAAVERFSQAEFEKGFGKGWGLLRELREGRVRQREEAGGED